MVKNLGQHIRRAREREGLTQAGLAEKLGVTAAAVSNWEGGREPKGDNKTKLELILGRLSTKATAGKPRTFSEASVTVLESEVSSFGLWLRERRTAANMSVPELASKSKISMPAIYNIESGKIRNPQSGTRDKLAKTLGQAIPEAVVNETESDQEIAGLGSMTDFDPHSRKDWPTCSGVYVLYDKSQRPIYVGKAKTISQRLGSHFNMFWFKDPIVRYGSYIEVNDDKLRHQLEQVMIKFLKANAVINTQSSEVFQDIEL